MRPRAISPKATLLFLILSLSPIAAIVAFEMPSAQQKQQSFPNLVSNIDTATTEKLDAKESDPVSVHPETVVASPPRSLVLVASLTVFVLAIFVGFEIIAKVPPTLHTPLMSGSNAISGITVIGAIIAAGYKETGVGSLLGLVAIVLAMINVVGGFAVTHRMLLMFKKR